MATLEALFNMRNNTALKNKIVAACANEAKVIFLEDDTTLNHTARLDWARSVFSGNAEDGTIRPVTMAVLVLLQDNATPDDPAIQAAVSSVVDKFAVEETPAA